MTTNEHIKALPVESFFEETHYGVVLDTDKEWILVRYKRDNGDPFTHNYSVSQFPTYIPKRGDRVIVKTNVNVVRIEEVLKQAELEKDVWYLSFVDENLPEGQRFLGGCYVMASSFEEAIKEAWSHNCNPGGEVLSFGLDFGQKCKPEYMNRLLNKTEVDEAVYEDSGS